MKWTTSWARDASNCPSANGRSSAAARWTPTPGLRAATAATNGSDGSTAATLAAPTRPTSSAVSAPGPQPDIEHPLARRHARQVGQLRGERDRVSAHEPVVRLGGDIELIGAI